METVPDPIERALEEMEAWLSCPRDVFETEVYRFAERLPGMEVLDAVMIAQGKFPDGGMRGFKYFCGVCCRKLDNQRLRHALNSRHS